MELFRKLVHILALISYLLIFTYVFTCIPYLFRYNPLVVLSGSMEPTLKTGSIIYYKNLTTEEIQNNDIIIYSTKSNQYVSHRVVKIEGNLYTTKGDANTTADVLKVEKEDIKGIYSGITIPYLGYYIKFINEHLYIIAIIIIILISEFLFTNTGIFEKRKGRN